MKFEQLLKIYWLKGFLYNGELMQFYTLSKKFNYKFIGISEYTKLLIIKRFELNLFYYDLYYNVNEYSDVERQLMNIFLSKISSVSNKYMNLYDYIRLKYYLIKAYKGRRQALGKPIRGQRTWSNAWTSYKYNTFLRKYIYNFNKLNENSSQSKVNNVILKGDNRVKRRVIIKNLRYKIKKIKKVKIKLWL